VSAAAGTAGPFIRVDDVALEYTVAGTAVRALAGVSLGIAEGEMACIMGPSGSGKTSLIHILGGLLTPTRGRVTVGGRDISRLTDDEASAYRNGTVGFVFQFFNLQPYYDTVENVALPLIFAGVGPVERRRRALAVLSDVGLDHRRHHKADELSGGEMQRVAIARALVNRPRLILADEPTGNLDRDSTATVMELLARINAEQHVTILVVTHNEALARYAHRTLRLASGELA
jgi:putative ABC transport system ATP-binding protein